MSWTGAADAGFTASDLAHAEPPGRVVKTAIAIARNSVKNCVRKIIVALPIRRRGDGVILEAVVLPEQG
jgi:hypothetical protein